MKKEKLLRAMELVDDKYVEEAAPAKVKHSFRWSRFVAIAACICCVITAAGLWLFLPYDNTPPEVAQFSGSEYYPIIQKLNEITYTENNYANNFDKFFSESLRDFTNGFLAVPESDNANGAMDAEESGISSYQEVTDNQVEGVIEADLIKRSDQHIYYLDQGVLRIFSIAGDDSREVGSYALKQLHDLPEYKYYGTLEFYLSEDCSTVTTVGYSNTTRDGTHVELISLDVTDPENITHKTTVRIKGDYLSSRLTDGKLLLLSQFYVGKNPDFSDLRNFVPYIENANGIQSIPADQIICPDTLTTSRYTVVCMLEADSLELLDSSAFLSYSQQVYVSADSIYATHGYTEDVDIKFGNGYTNSASVTEISRLRYAGDKLEHKGSVVVNGYVKDQYSMDEYNGLLRVVTTTSIQKYKETIYDGEYVTDNIISWSSTDTSANLYCIDLDTLQVVAEVKEFAPEGEVVQSVRFDKDMAYVCTSVQLSDPVFFFDLSDVNNITYTDTGTIDGFSSSLVNLGDGFLLGIGVGDTWNTVKIEVYEESGNSVVSVCKYEVEDAYYSEDYKSYLIDRNNRFIGLGITHYNDQYPKGEESRYVLLHFDDYALRELINGPLNGDNAHKRSVYVDGFLYLFGSNDFQVHAIG